MEGNAVEILNRFRKEDRPWGGFAQFTQNEKTTVKVISVAPGQAFSLQTHEHRDEFWHVLRGTGIVHIDGVDHAAELGCCFECWRGVAHRVTGGPNGITFLEISFGEFDEADIARLEDRYGRT